MVSSFGTAFIRKLADFLSDRTIFSECVACRQSREKTADRCCVRRLCYLVRQRQNREISNRIRHVDRQGCLQEQAFVKVRPLIAILALAWFSMHYSEQPVILCLGTVRPVNSDFSVTFYRYYYATFNTGPTIFITTFHSNLAEKLTQNFLLQC